MDPLTPSRDRLDELAVARLLVLLQGAVLVTATFESAVFLVTVGPAAGAGLVLGGAAALLTLATARSLGRGGRLARRWTFAAECGVLALVLLDLGVGLLVGGSAMTLMGVVLRVFVPLAVLVLLFRPAARAAVARPGGAA